MFDKKASIELFQFLLKLKIYKYLKHFLDETLRKRRELAEYSDTFFVELLIVADMAEVSYIFKNFWFLLIFMILLFMQQHRCSFHVRCCAHRNNSQWNALKSSTKK